MTSLEAGPSTDQYSGDQAFKNMPQEEHDPRCLIMLKQSPSVHSRPRRLQSRRHPPNPQLCLLPGSKPCNPPVVYFTSTNSFCNAQAKCVQPESKNKGSSRSLQTLALVFCTHTIQSVPKHSGHELLTPLYDGDAYFSCARTSEPSRHPRQCVTPAGQRNPNPTVNQLALYHRKEEALGSSACTPEHAHFEQRTATNLLAQVRL